MLRKRGRTGKDCQGEKGEGIFFVKSPKKVLGKKKWESTGKTPGGKLTGLMGNLQRRKEIVARKGKRCWEKFPDTSGRGFGNVGQFLLKKKNRRKRLVMRGGQVRWKKSCREAPMAGKKIREPKVWEE